VDRNSTFTISDSDFVKKSLPLTVIDSVFKIPTIGLYEICFHNINSTFYYNGNKTDLNQVAVFNFNDKIIKVDNDTKKCQPIFHNVKFFLIVYTRYEYPPSNVINTFVHDNKEYQEYIKSKNINVTSHTNTSDPITNAEVYVSYYWITEVIVGFTVLLIWAGIVLIFYETYRFVRGREYRLGSGGNLKIPY
jgi:hypothetical protein